ncbi:MAG: alpha/beta hydrolase [Maritimibacter sp.]|nr:alpha/beta hydrolase [Maritimibacter sp.]
MNLTDAYENGAYIPGSAQYPPRWTALASAFRETMGDSAECDISYGPGTRQAFDLFHPEGTPKGLVVFVHGGYWRRFDRTLWSHLAGGPLAQGWAVAMPSYTLAPDAWISEITVEIATAVAAAAARVNGPIVVTGHSAGGHLSARMRCRDVALPDAVGRRLERVVPISPLSDLRPLMQTEMNRDLRLRREEAASESPALIHTLRDTETIIWVGGAERPAFLDQARWLADAWPGSALYIDEGRHHFDVIDGLAKKDSALTRAVVGG